VQVNESGSLPYDIEEADSDGEVDDKDDDDHVRVVQAPIGTRPTPYAIERPGSPQKLNPAAQDFKSLFSFGEKKDKSEKSYRSKGKERSEAGPSTPLADQGSPVANPHDDTSPPQSRKSRDTRSVATADSSINDFSSTNSLDHTPSYAISDAHVALPPMSGSAGKESFMSKLSRKSSSGKFGLPVFQRGDKKQRTADRVKEASVGEDKEGEEEGGGPLSLSVDSVPRGPSEADRDEPKSSTKAGGRSWSAMFTGKIGKAKEKEKVSGGEKTPSISEASLTSASEANAEEGEVDVE